MDDGRLDALLVEVGGDVAFPPTPPMVDEVLAALADRRPSHLARRLRIAIAVAAVVILAVVALPGPRRALAELFGLGGVAITTTPELSPAPAAGELTGRAVTPEAAQAAAAFTVLSPEGYGDPAVVRFDDGIPGGLVTLAFEAGQGGYGLVITQMLGSVEAPLLEKVVGPDTTVTRVSVGEAGGYWIQGEPHLVIVLDRDGRDRADEPRLVGNTLLFVRDGVTIRVESALDLDGALAVAGSLAPLRTGG